MDILKYAVEQKILSEREAKKLLDILSFSNNEASEKKRYPYLKFEISPGGEISIPLDVEKLAEGTIARLLKSTIRPDILKDDKFEELSEKLVNDVVLTYAKSGFSYSFEGIEYEVVAEILDS